jgi:iron complex outermembrane recepter protein
MNCITRLALAVAATAMPTDYVFAQQIEEVIVTATRRAADIQDVPISISAYSGDFINDSGVDTLQDLSLYAPNFTFSTSSQPSNVRLIIRGIGSAGNSAIEPAVGVFIDGVYYPRPGSVLGNLVDMQSVEVLRGPQGTLFGRNTAAGALNMQSNDPGDELEGHVQAGAGDFDARSLETVVSTPLADNAAGRIAVRWSERDGYGFETRSNRTIGGRDDLLARGKLVLDLTDRLSVKIAADYNEITMGGNVIEVDAATRNPVFEGTLAALFGDTALTADGFDYVVNQDHQDRLQDEQWGLSADVSYEIGAYTLRSITATRDWQSSTLESSVRIPADILPRATRYETQTVSQELQLLSPSGEAVEYLLGLFLYDEDYDIAQSFDAGADTCIPVVFALAGAAAAGACAAGPQTPAVASQFVQSLSSYAAFAQATFNVSDRWSLTIGGRYTSEDKDGSFEQQLLNPVIGSLFRAPESEPQLMIDDSAFTWLLNASFFPSDSVMLFATASSGFKGGGFNSEGAGTALGTNARIFTAETSRNVELGVKSELLNRRMTANVTAYHTTLDDFQDRSFDGISFITRNAGSRTQSGVEADVVYLASDRLRLIGGASYLDAEFDSFAAASPLPGSTTPQDLGGTRPHYSPEWQGSLVADWHDRLGSGDLDWSLRAEWQYVGEQNIGGNTNNNPQSMQAAYSLFNLRAGFGNERWRLSLFVRNLAEEHYCQVKFDQPFGEQLGAVNATSNTSVQRCVLGNPRTFGANIRYDF